MNMEPGQEMVAIEIAPERKWSLREETMLLNIRICNRTVDSISVDPAAIVGVHLSGQDTPFMVSSRYEHRRGSVVPIASGDCLEFVRDVFGRISRKEELTPGRYLLKLRYEIGDKTYPSNEVEIVIEE